MTIARIRTPGTWTDGSVVLDTEMEAIDANLVKAVDGVAGGTYAPTNPLVIGGDGLEVTGPLEASGATTLGDVTVTGTLVVETEATFEDGIGITGGGLGVVGPIAASGTITGPSGVFTDVTVGDDLTVVDDATIGGTLGVTGTTTLGNVGADAIIAGVLQVQDSGSIGGEIQLYDAGRIRERVAAVTDTDMDLDVRVADWYFETSATLTGNHTFTILDDGASNGSILKLALWNIHDVLVRRESGSNIVTISGGAAKSLATFVRADGAWHLAACVYSDVSAP